MTYKATTCVRRALSTASDHIRQSSGLPRIASHASSTSSARSYSSFASATAEKPPRGPGAADDSSPNTAGLPRSAEIGNKKFANFDLQGRTFIVTGGAQGLGLATAEGLVEAGAKVYCLDRAPKPGKYWDEASSRVVPEWGGALSYRQVDVTETDSLNATITSIADENKGIHGAIAAAAIQQVTPALEYKPEDVRKMMEVNYTAVFMTATATARSMMRYGCQGSICFIASMSGSIANKGLRCPVYNSSKAAVLQLARNLAMEWGPRQEDGRGGGIRVNCISPGHILTPMVEENLKEDPELEALWCRENMLGRLSTTAEFKGAALFLMSNASSFMTGSNLTVDGGHTAW